MGGLREKKYQKGEGARYVTRKKALKILQLSLKDFRRLCILKGIYPREPRHRKKAQQGATGIKTLYYKKDIQFLMHEPVIWKLREIKVFAKKVQRARKLKDTSKMKHLVANHPIITLDKIVKERYPTFIDAIRDLDDCLTLCFLFATFPSLRHVPRTQSGMCRRLTVEFMHWVIAAKALRKVFVSIKGYYYQAEVKGQLVTWIVPHQFSFEPQAREDVDFKVMSTFVEFYVTMLGFVNFRLYHSLNLIYPPKFDWKFEKGYGKMYDGDMFKRDHIAALNFPLQQTHTAEEAELEVQIDEFPAFTDDPEKLEKAKQEIERVKKLKVLFEGCKVFLNREVPREGLVFILRSFGAVVSWDRVIFTGATFSEDDPTITHQIVDKPVIDKVPHPRFYVQPQWVFDCVNARELLPMNKYFAGASLPPHLSPFIDETKDRYIPPEEVERRDQTSVSKESDEDDVSDVSDDDGQDDKAEEVLESDDISDDDSVNEMDVIVKEPMNKEENRLQKKKMMSVTVGTVTKDNPDDKKRLARQEYRLREKMVPRKYHKLYKSMMKGRMERSKEAWLLRKKRRRHEDEVKVQKKAEKKQKLKAAVENV